MKALTVRASIDKFREAFQAGIQGIVTAAEVYVEAIDEDPRNADEFHEAFADCVPPSAWAQFEAVGRKWLHPKMIMGGVSNRKKNAAFKKLPYSVQERIFEHERFELLTKSGDTLKVDMLEATPEQVQQLCNKGIVRSVSEQRAWIEDQKVDTAEAVEVLPYTITGGSCVFRRSTKLNKVEMRRILQEM